MKAAREKHQRFDENKKDRRSEINNLGGWKRTWKRTDLTRNRTLTFAMTGHNTLSIKLTKPTGEQVLWVPNMNGNIWNDSCDMGLKGTEQRNCVCKNAKRAWRREDGKESLPQSLPPSLPQATSFLFPSCCTGQDSLCFPLEHHWTAKFCKQLMRSCLYEFYADILMAF